MGEARRRKALDPTYGMLNELKLLVRETEPRRSELNQIFSKIVPEEVAKRAFVFSLGEANNGSLLPSWLQTWVNDRKLTFDEAIPIWCGDVRESIDTFVGNLIGEYPQFANLRERIQIRLSKAIAHGIDQKAEAYCELIESGECDYPPTPEQFWHGRRIGNREEEAEP